MLAVEFFVLAGMVHVSSMDILRHQAPEFLPVMAETAAAVIVGVASMAVGLALGEVEPFMSWKKAMAIASLIALVTVGFFLLAN